MTRAIDFDCEVVDQTVAAPAVEATGVLRRLDSGDERSDLIQIDGRRLRSHARSGAAIFSRQLAVIRYRQRSVDSGEPARQTKADIPRRGLGAAL